MIEPLNQFNNRKKSTNHSGSMDSFKNLESPTHHLSNNSRELVPEPSQATKETQSIYGGVAGSVAPRPLISEPSSSKPKEEIATHWSSSINALLDQPPSKLPQRLISGGLAFCLALGTWAWFGTVEEVGRAQGKLIPQGTSYKIQPVELGKVSYIAVKEGDEVKAGQVLVEFDTELAQKEIERLQQAKESLKLEEVQKQALLKQLESESQTRIVIGKAEENSQQLAIALAKEKATTARELLMQQQIEAAAYRNKKIRLQPLSAKSEQRLQELEAQKIAHQERLERLKPLEEEGAVSQEYVFQAEQALRETEQQITQSQIQDVTATDEQQFQAEQSLRELDAQIIQNQGDISAALKEAERLQSELRQKQAQTQQTQIEALQRQQQLEVEITQLRGKLTETQNSLALAQAKLNYKYLKAPVDGIVLALTIKNPGEVIEAGKTIAEIAPDGAPLILSAVLPNQEAGFIKSGMPVKVKLDAYPYQDYGVISGKVKNISENTISDEKLGEVYRVEVELEQNYVKENKQQVAFKAGQTASADIIIRRKRVIDIILDPIKQIQKDGINL